MPTGLSAEVIITRSVMVKVLLLLSCTFPVWAGIDLSFAPLGQSWKALRDQGIEKQTLDDSCGSAAVATILRSYYGIGVQEEDIINAVNRINQSGTTSFADLQKVVSEFGFQAVGIAINFETLQDVKIPVLLYLNHQEQDHFSVLRGISESHVLLADPSWGNRLLTAQQFKGMWAIGSDQGKVLVIVPQDIKLTPKTGFFKPLETHPNPFFWMYNFPS